MTFFKTGAVYRPPRISWQRAALIAAAVIGGGGVLGYGIGLLVRLCGAPAGIEGFTAFIGCLDGVMAAGCHAACRNERHFGKEGKAGITLLMAMLYACVAVKVVLIAWPIILLNAVIGAVIGWIVHPREDWEGQGRGGSGRRGRFSLNAFRRRPTMDVWPTYRAPS